MVAPAGTVGHPVGVSLYMDRHEFTGLTAEEAAAAHLRDLEVQGQFGVRFLTYWFDEERQTAFCLASAPNKEAVEGVHRASHGFMAYQIIEVDLAMVERFMGGIVQHQAGEPYVDTAFRTILFTDIVGSTSLTQELGDARAMAMLRTHDAIVREAVAGNGGSEVKHTGDGIMVAFRSVAWRHSVCGHDPGRARRRRRPLGGAAPGPDRPCRRRAGDRARRPLRRGRTAGGPPVQSRRAGDDPRLKRGPRPGDREGLPVPEARTSPSQRLR